MTQEHALLSTRSFLSSPIILCPHNIIKTITGPFKQLYKDTIISGDTLSRSNGLIRVLMSHTTINQLEHL